MRRRKLTGDPHSAGESGEQAEALRWAGLQLEEAPATGSSGAGMVFQRYPGGEEEEAWTPCRPIGGGLLPGREGTLGHGSALELRTIP